MTDQPAPNTSPNTSQEATGGDLVADRRAKLERFRDELEIDPYGQRTDGLTSLADARASYDADADAKFKEDKETDNRTRTAIAGRVVLHRDIGKLVFMTLRDSTGDLQVAASKKSLGEQAFKIAKMVDLGDLVTASGPMGMTKTGEITVWAAGNDEANDGFGLAAKSLAPPPSEHYGFSDPETRYRKRYVDLWANPQVMKTMQLRIQIIDEIRQFLRDRGYLEVETPMLQTIHGGAAARPFETHHNALDLDLSLRIAPELYLKRLLVGGMPKVFEINRNFRNEGISPRHNPEFTMLEAYEAFGNWETMAEMVEEMVCTVAEKVIGTLKIEHKDAEGNVTKTIDLTRPWRRVPMVDLVEERTGIRFTAKGFESDTTRLIEQLLIHTGGEVAEILSKLQAQPSAASAFERFVDDYSGELVEKATAFSSHFLSLSPAEQLVEVYEKLIEHELVDPCFVTRVPSVIIPLAKECKDDPFFADVYELAINGVEISPGYTELNDPDVQEKHFRHQVGDSDEQQVFDEDFVNALRVGMPPAGGIGLGIDRLVMMLVGAESIRDVILFPLMRPQSS